MVLKILMVLAFSGLASFGAGPVVYEAKELEDLLGKLREVAPEGWKVSVIRSEDGSLDVELWREKKVQFYSVILPNSAGITLGEPEPPNPPKIFDFNFHLFPYLPPKEFARLTKENESIEVKLAKFTKALLDVPRHGKARAFGENNSRSYFPRNDKEKARVAEMAKYEKANPLHRLPQDYYFGKMSFGLFDPRVLWRPESKEINQECSKALELVLPVFSSYEDK